MLLVSFYYNDNAWFVFIFLESFNWLTCVIPASAKSSISGGTSWNFGKHSQGIQYQLVVTVWMFDFLTRVSDYERIAPHGTVAVRSRGYTSATDGTDGVRSATHASLTPAARLPYRRRPFPTSKPQGTNLVKVSVPPSVSFAKPLVWVLNVLITLVVFSIHFTLEQGIW